MSTFATIIAVSVVGGFLLGFIGNALLDLIRWAAHQDRGRD